MIILSYNELRNKDTVYYKYSLACCMLEYFKERHTKSFRGNLDTAIAMIDYMIDNNYLIYFTVDNTKDDIVTGFTILHIENQWGMLHNYLVVDYMFVTPTYRKGRVSKLLFITVGKCSLHYGLDVFGLAIMGKNDNLGNIMKVGGTPVAMALEITRECFISKYKKYMKGYK